MSWSDIYVAVLGVTVLALVIVKLRN